MSQSWLSRRQVMLFHGAKWMIMSWNYFLFALYCCYNKLPYLKTNKIWIYEFSYSSESVCRTVLLSQICRRHYGLNIKCPHALNSWSLVGGAVLGSCGDIERWSLAGGSGTLPSPQYLALCSWAPCCELHCFTRPSPPWWIDTSIVS
jgi:hypothetical protein